MVLERTFPVEDVARTMTPSWRVAGGAGQAVVNTARLRELARPVLMFLANVGCSSLEHCHGLKGGETLRIVVVEQRPGSAAPTTCNSTIGFPPGQEIHATIIRFGGSHTCGSGIAELEPAGGWSWELIRDPDDGGEIIEGIYKARNADCQGDLNLDVYGEGIPSEAPEPGQEGTTFMQLQYIPRPLDGGPEEGPPYCSVELTVTVDKM